MAGPDILMIVSDQHTAFCSGFMGDKIVRTPNLDRLAAAGTIFSAAYTSCPLCVPARASLVTGIMPSKLNVFSNGDRFDSGQPTYAHAAAIAGYETVLCGRMHFVGEDQYHGFTKRIFGDILHKYPGESKQRLGAYAPLMGYRHCLDRYGKGYNPVLDYDSCVTNRAAGYLTENIDKPLMMTVGFYGPHFPYFAPADLFDYYRDKVSLPETSRHEPNYRHDVVRHKEQEASDETILDIRADYYAMIEYMDREIKKILDAWNNFLAAYRREGIVIYTSDHGDQTGERKIFGKQTFYETSSRIPLVISGCGVDKGKKIASAASICDIAPTICELSNAEPLSGIDGISLVPYLHGPHAENEKQRPIYCEYVDNAYNKNVPGRMVRYGKWKLISYLGYEEQDLFFNAEDDPYELTNVINEHKDIAGGLKELLNKDWNPQDLLKREENKSMQRAIMQKWGNAVHPEDPLLWHPAQSLIKQLV